MTLAELKARRGGDLGTIRLTAREHQELVVLITDQDELIDALTEEVERLRSAADIATRMRAIMREPIA